MRHTPATTPIRHIPVDVTRFGDRRAQYICAVCGEQSEGELYDKLPPMIAALLGPGPTHTDPDGDTWEIE